MGKDYTLFALLILERLSLKNTEETDLKSAFILYKQVRLHKYFKKTAAYKAVF